jgi:hypothetical protein
MNERNYDKQSTTEYLLGSLAEAENERFDELSFTNDEFSDYLKAVENDLIDAYLNDELSGVALEKFQTYYLASPLRREKVEFAKALHTYAAKNTAPAESKDVNFSEQPKKSGFFVFSDLFAKPVFGWAFASVVLFLIAVAGFWFVKRNSEQPGNDLAMQQTPPVSPQIETPFSVNANETTNIKDANLSSNEKEKPQKTPAVTPSPKPTLKKNTDQTPIVASFVLSPPLRGAGNLPNVSFSKDTTVLKIALILEGEDYKTYRVALVDESNRQLWQSGNLKTRNKNITADFSANLLKSGVYSLVLSGVKNGGEAEIIGNYSFRAVKK